MYPNASREYNRSMSIKRSTSYNVRNSKRLEMPTFQTIRHGNYTFRYDAVKLWNMLENKHKDMMNMMNLKSFKKSIYLWAGPMYTCSYCLPYALYRISSHLMYFVLSYIITSSLFITYQLASLLSINALMFFVDI